MKIAVIGTGYVGLVMGAGLAEIGHSVRCLDRDEDLIRELQQGRLPIHEAGLEELYARNMEEERLSFTSDPAEAVGDAVVVFVCVGTPSRSDGSANLDAVFEAAETIARRMTGYRIIVNKSTCPPGTTDAIAQRIAQLTTHDFDVVSNPEFLREGSAVDDFMRPDRIIVGAEDVRVLEIMRELYAPLLRTGNPFLKMSVRSAELAKYAVNTMLAARISMINQLSQLAEVYGADIEEVREGLASDKRIGGAYIYPSLGYGGSCLPKDVQACIRLARDRGVPGDLFEAIHSTNEHQLQRFIDRILGHYGAAIRDKRLAFWGATFKARTDDVRNAPGLRVVDALLDAGARVVAYDPVAGAKLKGLYGDRIETAAKTYAALEGADGLVIAAEWREFQSPDYERMAALMREPVIFDGRNLYAPRSVAERGFKYFSIGRPSPEE